MIKCNNCNTFSDDDGIKLHEDIEFLLNLLGKGWFEKIEKGMVPMFYTTLTYEGDIKIQKRVKEIAKKINYKRNKK